MAAVVRDVWPASGPLAGGTHIWLLTARAGRGKVSFGFRSAQRELGTEGEPLEVPASNSTRYSPVLVSAVSPAAPSGVQLQYGARIHVDARGDRKIIDRLDSVRGLNGFQYYRGAPPRIPRVLPALFDMAAGLPALARGYRGAGGRVPRAVPPGSTCEAWAGLRALDAASCEALATRLRVRWQAGRSGGGDGCVLWERTRSISFSAPAAGRRRGCAAAARGGHCLCLGPPAPSQGATRRAIVSGRAYDARPARAERSRDLCVRARLWRQARLPLQGWHEVEAPAGHMCAAAPTQNGDVEVPAGQGVETGGAAGGGAACEVDAAGANATVDIVIAAHSQPVASMVRALVGALPSGVAPTVHVYAKGPALDGKGARRQLEAALARTAAPRARLVVHTGMENVGRCDHTYLHHIVENYDSLADATLFVKDTTAAHSHLGVFAKVLTFARRLPRSFRFWCARVFSAASSNFTMDGYSSELCHSDRRFSNARVVSKRLAHCYANESFVRSPLRPLGAWMDTHAVRRVRWAPQRLRVPFCAGGTFAASRAGVRSTPRATYEALRRALSKADNLEEGHYMERSWSSVMSGGAVSVERSRLVVYTVEGGGGEGPGVAPCNRSVTAKMDEGAAPGGLSWKAVRGRGLPVACLCFGSTDAFLDGCRRRGWRAKNIFTGASAAAAEAARLRRTPHASPQLAGADYTVLADAAADGQPAALNLPLLLDRLDALLTGAAASVAVYDARGGGGRQLVVVRRMTDAAARFGEVWARRAEEEGEGEGDARALDAAVAAGGGDVATVARREMPKLVVAPDELGAWWGWWSCRRKCCEPGSSDEAIAREKARAKAGGRPQG